MSGRVFSVPTYFFIGIMFLTLVVGAIKYFTGTLGTVQFEHEIVHHAIEPLTLFLILRAFSSGCAALTGIEAISNGITAFKQPCSRMERVVVTSVPYQIRRNGHAHDDEPPTIQEAAAPVENVPVGD